MTMEKFRVMHSELIEHYQFIEHHLEGIYAMLCGKSFFEGLEEVATSNLSQLRKAIGQLEKEKGISVFASSDYERLEHIRKRRNFWTHNCYIDMVVDRKTGDPKDKDLIVKMLKDMQDAVRLREDLYQVKDTLRTIVLGSVKGTE